MSLNVSRFVHRVLRKPEGRIQPVPLDFANPEPIHEEFRLHPSMLLLDPWVGSRPPGVFVDWDGSLYIPECLPQELDSNYLSGSAYEEHSYREPDEEMFEWVDVLESIHDAKGSFTFVELGAGYGRWSIRAFNAARRFGIPASNISLVTVEAEAVHSNWLLRNFEMNHIPHSSHMHFECAVSDWSGDGQFYVFQPGESDREWQAKRWYGQALVRADNSWAGAGTELVKVSRLNDILSSLPSGKIIDLLDMDLQGEDSRVLESSLEQLSRVRKVHVGTDSIEEDSRIFNFMSQIGWTLIRRYLPLRTSPTAYGHISFVDGVMTWRNPKL